MEEKRMTIVPVTLKEAKVFVGFHHRHHKPPQGGLFAVAVAEQDAEEPCGIAIVGRPVSRHVDDGWTVEVTRLCTLGQRNACSMLYRAAWRAAKAMGYRKLVTYTLPEEGGASCRAAGMKCLGERRAWRIWRTVASKRCDRVEVMRCSRVQHSTRIFWQ